MKTSRIYAFLPMLFAFTLTISSCGPHIYKAQNFGAALQKHKTVAILPAEVTMKLRPNQSKKTSESELREMEKNTGYDIQAKFGLPVSHVWSVAVYSSIDFESFDFSGLPSWGAERWFETRFIDTQVIEGLPISTIAGGSVLTTGGLCVSGSPTDTITG